MENPIDPVEFGKLVGSMTHLTEAINQLSTKVEALEAKANTGRGVILGALLVAASLGGAAGATFHKIFEFIK